MRERPAHLHAGNDAPRDTGTTQDRTGSRVRINSGEMAVKTAAVYFVRGAWLIHTHTGEATPQPANREKVFNSFAGGWGANYPPHRKKRGTRRRSRSMRPQGREDLAAGPNHPTHENRPDRRRRFGRQLRLQTN